jgi:hypothetical protein
MSNVNWYMTNDSARLKSPSVLIAPARKFYDHPLYFAANLPYDEAHQFPLQLLNLLSLLKAQTPFYTSRPDLSFLKLIFVFIGDRT